MANSGGARLTKHYTREQVDALLDAVLVQGISQAEVERRAMAGTLKEGLAPFGRPRFIYQLIRRGRDQFEAGNDDALDSGHGRELKRLYLLALKKARSLDEKADVAEIARHAKAVGEAHKALRGAETKPRAPKAKPSASDREPETTPQSQEDVLASLRALVNTPNQPSGNVNTPAVAQGEAGGPVPSLAR